MSRLMTAIGVSACMFAWYFPTKSHESYLASGIAIVFILLSLGVKETR